MEVIESLATKSNEAPGDYTGPDGLLYCGRCHTPKQVKGFGMFAGKVLPIVCKCAEEEQREAAKVKKQDLIEALRARCLPAASMHERTFKYAGKGKHILIAKRYVEKWYDVNKQNIGLLLWGNSGSGKTFTAQCIANALIDRGIYVGYTTGADLVDALSSKERRNETMNLLRSVPLLIIDDLGAERDTNFAREQICVAIDARSDSGKPLVVTTNYTLEEMTCCSDTSMQRVFDRLFAACVPVAVVGDSKRKYTAKLKRSFARELLEQ